MAYIPARLARYRHVRNCAMLSVLSPESRRHGWLRDGQAWPDARGAAPTGWQHLYARHRPEQTPLYSIIEQHAHRFFAELHEQGASLPNFVQAEFQHYLRCGRLQYGLPHARIAVAVATDRSE